LRNFDLVKAGQILDALDTAKAAVNLLPQSPLNIKPAHIRVLIAIYRVRDDAGCARVSGIARNLRLLFPNVTKLINELVNLKILEKSTLASDKRVVLVKTTESGEQYMQEIKFYLHRLAEEFSRISKSNRKCMIETITQVYKAINKVCDSDRILMNHD
jgi:DNA-binding MarR family transcriptional regulator